MNSIPSTKGAEFRFRKIIPSKISRRVSFKHFFFACLYLRHKRFIYLASRAIKSNLLRGDAEIIKHDVNFQLQVFVNGLLLFLSSF